MASAISWKVIECRSASQQQGEGLSLDFDLSAISVLWATSFASVLESHFVEPVRDVLRTICREMDLSRKGSHFTPTYQTCSYHRPGEPCVESNVGDMMVILKPPLWEMDTESVGGTN